MLFIDYAKAAVKRVPPLYWSYRALKRGYRAFSRVPKRYAKRHKAEFRERCTILGREVRDPTFAKIGANDGVTGDPCSDILLSSTSWKGVLIEPVPYCFDRLRENFGDPQRFTLEQVAIGAKPERITFYYVDRIASDFIANLPNWYDQIGSFDRSHIIKHLDGKLEPFIRELEVEVITLGEALKRNGIQYLDLLHIDTEGHDFEVLKSLDFLCYSPSLIFIEHAHLAAGEKKEMRRFLCERGYSIRDCGNDYYCYHKDAYQSALRQRALQD